MLLDGETAPSAAEVKEADNSTSVEADIETEITIDGLDSDNDYDIYFIAEDIAGNLQDGSDLQLVDVTTDGTTYTVTLAIVNWPETQLMVAAAGKLSAVHRTTFSIKES
ncbi:MAG: hypothetical protein ACOC1N_05490 [Bacillota bacterium]